MSHAITVVEYDQRRPLEFESERARIAAALGSGALRIDHHGPTAVAGLAAKPVIDIQVSVVSLQPMDAYRMPLVSLGYVHMPHADDVRCPFFYRPAEWPHTHHVHVVESDYLRTHQDAAGEYAALKRRLAAETDAGDRNALERYARRKSAFVDRIVWLAFAEGLPRL